MDELRGLRSFWQGRSQSLGHAEARKGAAKYMRDVEKEIDAWKEADSN